MTNADSVCAIERRNGMKADGVWSLTGIQAQVENRGKGISGQRLVGAGATAAFTLVGTIDRCGVKLSVPCEE